MRVVVIADGGGGLKAYPGNITGTGRIYFTRTGHGEVTIVPDEPTERPADDWVSRVGGDKLHIDESNAHITLDDGRTMWGISCSWFEVALLPGATL
jgi:hypothetical protein